MFFQIFINIFDVITLPIEGDIITHAHLRSEVNFKQVIEILDLLLFSEIRQIGVQIRKSFCVFYLK